ncbi:MAG TPA: FAD-binding oxidoreductase, partial [Methylomirabilota bacterium]|nr:FAD-binding oxidoreductase [Methylomirabilota bacterium]
MARTADVVVVGGGANGTSTAFHLALLGVRDVVLLERRHLAAGATGKSGALVRMHYTNEPESRLAFESLKVFRNFAEAVGGDCGFEGVGFLQLVGHAHVAALRRNVERQQAIGIATRVIAADEVRALVPGIELADVGAAAWEPESGFADPAATAFAFAEAARVRGARIETGVEVLRVLTEDGRVTGVETSAGRIATRAVVIAAGAWSTPLLAPLGLDYPLTPHRIQVAIFRWPAGLARRHPAMIDAVHHAWLRPEGRAATLIGVELGAAHADPDTFEESVDERYVAVCRGALAARWPAFAGAVMRGGWAGMIMMSADARPIIDRVGPDGLWAMLGDSGTSFKTSPAIGRCLAEWITAGAPATVDLRPFRASRF